MRSFGLRGLTPESSLAVLLQVTTSRVQAGETQLPRSLTGVAGRVAHNALQKLAVVSETYEVNFDGRTF